MDPTIRSSTFTSPNHQPFVSRRARDSVNGRRNSGIFSQTGFGVLVVIASFVQTGCQTSRFVGSDMPVPPAMFAPPALEAPANEAPTNERDARAGVDDSSEYLIRSQSPDEGGSRRVKSLIAGPIEAPPLHDPSRDALTIAGLKEQQTAVANPSQVVKAVIIKGNRRVPTHHITRNLGTREGRYYDPDRLQEDSEKLWRMPEISRINGPFIEQTPDGVVITIEVFEKNIINDIQFIGNRELTDRKLLKESGLEMGGPLDVYQVKNARSRIEELYKSKGFPRTQVEIMEGDRINDGQIIFLIHEDQKQRIWKAEFEGNQIASDARLRTFVESKPGVLKLFGGLVNRDAIEQDLVRLTNYYRSLGYFNARIGREIQESNDGRWMTVRFIINEGPRYKIRNVAFIGNNVYSSDELDQLVKLKPNEATIPSFNSAKMNADVVALRDLYGSQGYVFANVEAEPRFLEEPGMLDIVYKITEGKQYRAGDINLHFEGNNGVTRREVVMSRMSVRPGDIIDAREIRNSERRLGAAGIFADRSTGSQGPRVVVRPPELRELERYVQGNSQKY